MFPNMLELLLETLVLGFGTGLPNRVFGAVSLLVLVVVLGAAGEVVEGIDRWLNSPDPGGLGECGGAAVSKILRSMGVWLAS
jgi:hypothetical protein